jgi:hypothetical protein
VENLPSGLEAPALIAHILGIFFSVWSRNRDFVVYRLFGRGEGDILIVLLFQKLLKI